MPVAGVANAAQELRLHGAPQCIQCSEMGLGLGVAPRTYGQGHLELRQGRLTGVRTPHQQGQPRRWRTRAHHGRPPRPTS